MATQKSLPMRMLIAELEAVKSEVKLDSVFDLLSSIQNLIENKYVPLERGHIRDALDNETWDTPQEYMTEVYDRNIPPIPTFSETPLFFYLEDGTKLLGEYIASEDSFVVTESTDTHKEGWFEYRRWVTKWEYVNPPNSK
jgi:hypothetical protein